MACYKINLGLLDSSKNDIQADRDNFENCKSEFNSFSAVDSTSLDIIGPIKASYATVENGFNLLIDWLNDYINAVQETDNNAKAQINEIMKIQFDFGYFGNQSSSSGVGSIGYTGSSLAGMGTNNNASSDTVKPTMTPYDELFEKLKVTQDTKELENNAENIENEIKKLEDLLEKESNPTEQEKIKSELNKLYEEITEVKYEIEILTLVNSLQSELSKFSNFEEYKAYVENLKKEIDETLEILNSDKYTVVDVLHLMINKDYNPDKLIYVYYDKTGLHFSLEDPTNTIEGIEKIGKLTFNDINKIYENNDLFTEYKEKFIDNNESSQIFTDKINNLYESYNSEKEEIIKQLLPKIEEYNKHQKIVEYIESKVN